MEGGDVAAASPPVDGGGEAREARKPAKAPDAGVVKERKPSPSGVGVVRRAAPPPGAPGGGRPEAPLLPGGAGKEKDLMKIVVQQNKKQAAANADMCAIMVGTASCGKSTLLKGLKNNDEEPKPTLALEYSFLRKINAADGRKDVAHLWEIGGGTAMQNMLDVPLTESSVKTATVVIVADLSQPDELFVGVSYWLERLRLRMQDIDKVFKSKEATARLMDQLKERSAKRFGEKHPDNLKDGKEGTWGRGMIKHTGVNVIIVATKWDLFAKKDPELKKVMGRCLRFLAHMNGASLLYCGQGEKMLVDKFRAILSHYLFKAPAVKTKETNHLKPLVVPAGSDSLEDIGLPPVLDKSAMEKATTPLDLWKGVYEGYFCKNGVSPELPTGPATLAEFDPDRKFEEKAVDSALYQKELDLELHRDSTKRDLMEERRDARAGAPKVVRRVSAAPPKSTAPPP